MEFLEETVRKDPNVSWAKFVAKMRMKATNFEDDEWFKSLTSYNKDLVRSLEYAQRELPDSEYPLQSVKDPLRAK